MRVVQSGHNFDFGYEVGYFGFLLGNPFDNSRQVWKYLLLGKVDHPIGSSSDFLHNNN